MPRKAALDPEDRALYGASLQPPPGYVFEGAVATTYSLDMQTALAAPVSLALFAAEDRDELLRSPLALLEGAERAAGKLLVFTDAGRIHAQEGRQSRLCALLERIVVEVAAPRGGAFHPKLWAMRFRPLTESAPGRVRLLVTSRNLTRDRSWDAALILDGVVGGRARSANRPLVDLVRRLPELATAGLPEGAGALVEAVAEDLRRAVWEPPAPFEDVAFAVNCLGGRHWRPESCARLGVVSPFVDAATLDALAALAREAPLLIGRSEELAAIPPATLAGFARVAVLDETAEREDGEEAEVFGAEGLHAKLFVAEQGWDVALTVGSGNATRTALGDPPLSGRTRDAANVEIFATLTGKRSQTGGVEDILGAAGFGRLTREYRPDETEPPADASRAAERRLEAARRTLCRGRLALGCERAPQAEGATLWSVRLTPPGPLPLADIETLRVWPVTRGEGHGRDALGALRRGEAVELGPMPLLDVTRFVAFSVTESGEGERALFSTGLPVEGLPEGRQAAILHWVIDDRAKFLAYLRLLLCDLGDPFAAALAAQAGAERGAWRAGADDQPILEDMVRALCHDLRQLDAIDRLMRRLDAAPGEEDPVPAEFRALWGAFRTALETRRATHDG